MPFCIYTDQDVSVELGNLDHIIPLSLGGSDDFCIWSDSDYNSELGSAVDGVIANDFLVMLARRDADARGHNKREPVPIWKRTTLAGQPVQVKLGREKIEVWDAKTRSIMPDEDVIGREFETTHQVDRFDPIRFTAKVALGAAYFIYEDAIRVAMDCNALRQIISLDPVKARVGQKLLPAGITVCDRLHADANGDSATGSMYRGLCEFTNRSTVIAVPHDDSIGFHVGVLGMFMASIFIPADTSTLPNDGLHDLGHVILLAPGQMERISFRELALKFQRSIDEVDKEG